jgi:hypothetical protein
MVDGATMLVLLLLATIALAAGFVFLAVRLAQHRPEPRLLRCPSTRTRAVVVVLHRRDGVADGVAYCSHWATGQVVTCDRACLTRAA